VSEFWLALFVFVFPFLVHLLVVEVVHHLAGPHLRLSPTPGRLLLSLLVQPCVLSLRTRNTWLARRLCGRQWPQMIMLPWSHLLWR
jgi:hypothetical protein